MELDIINIGLTVSLTVLVVIILGTVIISIISKITTGTLNDYILTRGTLTALSTSIGIMLLTILIVMIYKIINFI